MFSPAGYHPAAALWIEFLNQRLESSYASTVLHYRKPKFSAGVVRGSPLDICEHYFLKSLAEVGIFLASPSGEVLKVHTLLRDMHSNLLSVLGPYESAWHMAAMKVEAESAGNEPLALPPLFTCWPHEPNENDAWAKAYPEEKAFTTSIGFSPFQDLKHHTLPFHFRRRAYTISPDIPAFAQESALSWNVAPILENYAGWSICLDEATYQGEWAEYLYGHKKLFPSEGDESISSQTGRPKLAAERAAFASMGFDKGDLSWEQLARKIQKITGHKPSKKSLRNWQKEYFDEQKLNEPP